MDPLDQQYGAEPTRYLQLVCTLEVEVIDREKADAYLLDSSEEGVTHYPNPNLLMTEAVRLAVARGLDGAGPRAGFKVLSWALSQRPRAKDGQYVEITLGPAPNRRDDGSYES